MVGTSYISGIRYLLKDFEYVPIQFQDARDETKKIGMPILYNQVLWFSFSYKLGKIFMFIPIGIYIYIVSVYYIHMLYHGFI